MVMETLFSPVCPSNSLLSISDPWRAFWGATAPFQRPQLALCTASKTTEMQGHLQLSRPRHRGPQRLLRTTDANLVCAFDENDLLFIVPNIWRAGAPLYDPPPCMSVFPPTLFAYVIPISCMGINGEIRVLLGFSRLQGQPHSYANEMTGLLVSLLSISFIHLLTCRAFQAQVSTILWNRASYFWKSKGEALDILLTPPTVAQGKYAADD